MAVPKSPAVVLTRQAKDNQKLAQALAEKHVPVVQIPCIETRLVKPVQALPSEIDALIFTSRHGVAGFLALHQARQILDSTPQPKVAAVGQATQHALCAAGIRVDYIPQESNGLALADVLRQRLPAGSRLGWLHGNLRASAWHQDLQQSGFTVFSIQVYENREPNIPQHLPFRVAAVFCASPSAGKRLLAKNPWLMHAPFYCIGHTTQQALLALGVTQVTLMGVGLSNWTQALCAAHKLALQEGPGS